MTKKVGLHWFRKDLRLNDNPSLAAISSSVDELICVYQLNNVVTESVVTKSDFITFSHSETLGQHRANFIYQSLKDLNNSLQKHHQRLAIMPKTSIADLVDLIDANNITHISAEWHCGVHERTQWQELQTIRPDLIYIQENATTLYQEQQFPFSIENMPATFSPFRKKVEKYCQVSEPQHAVNDLPKQINTLCDDKFVPLSALTMEDNYYVELIGGETSALNQLNYYLWDSDALCTYKETRNGLDGWAFSSKLSAWLAQGCISPRTIAMEISKYEQKRVKNDSTYWLFFELLWREFFHWHLCKHGATLFAYSGVQGVSRNSSIDKQKIIDWQKGNTGFPIVDACMRQLAATGFMSNRGRQLVASCFVHELGQNWRYGALYFETQLIDFDVASNWGNWQYLGGVGADPRGHRQFNLAKQTDTYDPSRTFIQQWT